MPVRSSRWLRAISAGVDRRATSPNVANASITARSRSALLMAVLAVSMTVAGVRAGASRSMPT